MILGSPADVRRAVEAGLKPPSTLVAADTDGQAPTPNPPNAEAKPDPIALDGAATLPPDIAYLYLTEDGADAYVASFVPPVVIKPLRGKERILNVSASSKRPKLSLVEHVGGGLKIKSRNEFWKDVWDFSTANADLGAWLNALYNQPEGPQSIVIYDYLSLPFPWEMVVFEDAVSQKPLRLGSAFDVVRWQPSQQVTWQPTDQPDQVQGKLIAYLSDDISRKELPTLQQYTHDIFDDIQTFKARLLTDESECGLVYLGCHAIMEKETRRWMALGSASNEAQRLTLYELLVHNENFARLKLLEKRDAIVFLNACHSALTSEPDDKTGVERNFPETFLAKGAGGVIATIGLIDDVDFAPAVPEAYITAVNQGTPIARVLRDVRRDYLNKLYTRLEEQKATQNLDHLPEPNHEQLKEFFNAFMYVYYGSPHTKLQVE